MNTRDANVRIESWPESRPRPRHLTGQSVCDVRHSGNAGGMMNALLRCSLAVVVALILGGTSAWAQATAGITGTARDESGAVLPGVTITVTQTDTGLTRTTASNETGSYSLPNLPVGPYRVEAALQGFRTYTQTIVLQVNSAPVINPTLAIGNVAEN